ncbi:MAG: hypothetical protein ACE5LU_10090 [Anaerolineae bacterium]
MKPGKLDRRFQILITGAELEELQKHTYLMAESFGLDRRIDRYKGKRPVTLYRWDLECLLDVLDTVLVDPEEYPSYDSPEYLTLKSLHERLRREYDEAYS